MTDTATTETTAFERWSAQVPQEVQFWESWVATRGREWPEDFALRFEPQAPLAGRFGELVAGLPGRDVRLLDVGAGPVTVLGKTSPGKAVEIVAVDPLADAYAELLDRDERLTERFAPGSFDVAHARNAIDHSYDPMRVIANMVAVVRPGGLVFLGHESNEAINERYVGLHQWNFDTTADGAFVIWSPEGVIDVTERLRGLAEVTTRHADGWLEVVIVRAPGTEGLGAEAIARLTGLGRRFDRHLVEMVVEVSSPPSPADAYSLATTLELVDGHVVVTPSEPGGLDDALRVATTRSAHVGLLAGGDALPGPLDLRGETFSAYAADGDLDRMPLQAGAGPEYLSSWLMRSGWLASVLEPPKAEPEGDPEPPPVRGRRVLACLEELREAPELLARWAEAFSDDDDLTLVISLPPGDEAAVAWLEETAASLGLAAPGAPDLLALPDGDDGFARGATGRLSTREDPGGAGPALGLLTDPAALRERVLPAPASGPQADRVEAMRARWDCARVTGRPDLRQPALMTGPGEIRIGDGAVFGWPRSPGFLTGYAYVEAGLPGSVVEVGPGCFLNNDVCLRSEGPGITIGRDVLIGCGVHVYDSDFHAVDPRARLEGRAPRTAAVVIEDGAWIGSNAMILKGVVIGAGAVVAAGAIVTRSVPPATLVAGNPARFVRTLGDEEDPARAGA